MKLIKAELTFSEMFKFVDSTCDTCFNTDKEGNDTAYLAQCKIPTIQATFCEYYTDMEFLPTETGDADLDEKNFNINFSNYMNVDIDDINLYTSYESENIGGKRINQLQWNAILNAIDEQIEFRKQKMLQKNIKVTSILDEEIIKLSAVLAKAVEELPKSFDYSSIQPFVDKINSMRTIDEKKIVKAVVNNNHSLKNKLFGHKKAKKKVVNQTVAKNAPVEE